MGRREPRRARHLHFAGERRLSAESVPVAPLPFEDSRRLTGPNPYFGAAGAVLETLGPQARDAAAVASWRARVEAMCVRLGWPAPRIVARAHASGYSLAFTAPEDRLLSATEVDEWAWCAAVGDRRHHAPGHPLADDEARAFDTLSRFAAAERRPDLIALLAAAEAHAAPVLLDDDALTLGLGRHAKTWPLEALPSQDAVDWSVCGRIPTALVTGSNGKTTTVRTFAAILRAHGLRTAHSCTDGLFVGDARAIERLQSGDYSGPAGARQLLRRDDVDAAVLETARGGILRRGLALRRADVALVTNISADHFGEYGLHDLDDLADAKFTVARAVADDGRDRGWLVLNADDALLRARADASGARVAWFSPEAFATVAAGLPADAPLCAVDDGRLRLRDADGRVHDLGEIAAMPLTLGGVARYNIANVAGAAVAASLLRVPVDTIRATLAAFGARHEDNPGRLQHWRFAGIEVYLDYAHNPDGLAGLLDIATARRGSGRLALLLGQAGNRDDDQIRALAAVAARSAPDLVVVKDLDGYLRGRQAGEVAGILREELVRRGLPESALPVRLREADAARAALAWAREGDVLVLPVHSLDAKAEVSALLDALQAGGWRPGRPLPVETSRETLRSSAPSDGAASV